MSEQDRAVMELLNRAYAYKHNSLAAYILSAAPYIGPGLENLHLAIKKIADQDQIWEAKLAASIEEQGGISRSGPYQTFVSELNYLSLSYLSSVLRQDLAKQLAEFEKEQPALNSAPQARKLIEEMCAAIREQLQLLPV